MTRRSYSTLLIGLVLGSAIIATSIANVVADEGTADGGNAEGGDNTDIAANDAPRDKIPALSLADALEEGTEIMQMAETAQKDEEYFSFTPVHDAYARAAAIMMNSLDADGDWDFDSDSAKDRQRELLIYSIAKAIERQAEMNFNEGEMKLAKEQYKQVQSVLFTLMPKRQHVTSQKLKDSYERQSDHIRKKFSQGYLQDLEKQVKDRTKIEAHITQIIDNNVKEELGEAFFEEKAFTKDEMHLYFKSNLQLGYIYSKRASEVQDEEKKEALIELADQEYTYAKEYASTKSQYINLYRELATHHLRANRAKEAADVLETLVHGKYLKDSGDDTVELHKAQMKILPGVYTNLGVAYFGMKSYRLALNALQTALIADGNNSFVHLYTVRAYLKLNKPEKAFDFIATIEDRFGPQQSLDTMRRSIKKYLKNQKAKKEKEAKEEATASASSSASQAR